MIRLPLMSWGPYGPYLATVLSSRANAGRTECRRQWAYSLWCVEDGAMVHEMGGDHRVIRAPCAIFVAPRSKESFVITEHSSWRALVFNAVYQRLKAFRGSDGARMVARIHAVPKLQPPAEEIWGLDLPAIVPKELVASALSMAHFCQSLWWRDDLGYARANHRLGQWLLAFVAWISSRQSLEEHDWLARAEHAARERLNAGRVTVAGLARISGVSRQLLHRSFVRLRGRSPSQFLQELWLERAKALLEQTDQQARGIGLSCGFRFSANFCRQFRKHTGFTPLAWRRAHRR
jgi:AraC-like DNA-binding protein